MKHYEDYKNDYNALLQGLKQGERIVKYHLYVCMNFLEDNGVTANPWERETFAEQLEIALSKFPQNEQDLFLKAIWRTLQEFNKKELQEGDVWTE